MELLAKQNTLRIKTTTTSRLFQAIFYVLLKTELCHVVGRLPAYKMHWNFLQHFSQENMVHNNVTTYDDVDADDGGDVSSFYVCGSTHRVHGWNFHIHLFSFTWIYNNAYFQTQQQEQQKHQF